MLLSVSGILVAIAFALTLISGTTGKVPLWIAVLLLTVALLVGIVARG